MDKDLGFPLRIARPSLGYEPFRKIDLNQSSPSRPNLSELIPTLGFIAAPHFRETALLVQVDADHSPI
jgi:hypothetical protein